jgi:hypothetical protein
MRLEDLMRRVPMAIGALLALSAAIAAAFAGAWILSGVAAALTVFLVVRTIAG